MIRPRREMLFTEKDAALRDDVRTLGALVGDVIREQGGEALFQRVEAARVAAIRRREEGGEAEVDAGLQAAVGGLEPRDAGELVHGFATYFNAVNLAERIHRIRRGRDYLRASGSGAPPQEGSLEDTVRRLASAGLGPADMGALLQRLLFEPVFTAHPTEATRRTLLEKQQTIGRLLVRRLDPSLTPAEERATLGRIREEITVAWQTEAQFIARPTVLDELEHILFFLTDVVYRVVPPFYEALGDALATVYGTAGGAIPVPPMLRFASWVGGDMDGNPNVTADTIRAALARHRMLVLERYQREALELAQRLTQSVSRVGVDEAVTRRSADYAACFPAAFAAVPGRYHDMPYRVFFHLIAARISATQRDEAHGYGSAEELAGDLRLVSRSLLEHRGEHAGLFSVRRLVWRVETFGFHLATLDVRQDALVHRTVAGRLLGDGGWLERSGADRAARVARAIASGEPPVAPPDEDATRTLAVFRAIAECRARYGPHAIGPYIISMTQGADDVLTVLLLARWAGLGPHPVPLDVAPLFETDDDLKSAPQVMAALLADAVYRAHLEARDRHQIVMIGYSDSNKDAGIAASRWALQRAQATLVGALQPAGIDLTIFHGRGGTVSRGGGKLTRAVQAAPPGSVRGRLRITEQGEAISASYGLRGIALRTLEQAVGAVALATALSPTPDDRSPHWDVLMEEIASSSHAVYRALVYDDPRFVEYFRLATPIDVIERMPIGSRPPARRSGTGIQQLRAIPWVFAWTQSRHVLPGWYGIGTALERAVARHGEAAIAEMLRDWPFLRALVDDVEMVLAKADIAIAARYAKLAGPLEAMFFPAIRAEFERTVACVLRLKGTGALLDGDPVLQRSIRLRNPYVDPMSLLQVELLARWRGAGRPDDDLFGALLA
ncbi:MAG TPA: phosphoenolpyruvate carboxylase, partial [Gemmatimonadales bacterium]|nr:phosphoenolpyruvate carboxylase [Gemmatimonadales bacterium]